MADPKPHSVLVADDDPPTRMLVTRWLTKAGCDVVEADDGESAVRLAHERAATLDAIVLDVMMPGLDGFEALTRLREHVDTAAIPVVLLTAHATGEKDLVRSAESGAIDHLTKPFSGPVLVAKVRAACERGRAARALKEKLV